MAIYMAEMLQGKKTEDAEASIGAFTELLGTRPTLIEEFNSYCKQLDKVKTKVKVMNSLEVNLMLVFLWLGCLSSDLPVLEKDILRGA